MKPLIKFLAALLVLYTISLIISFSVLSSSRSMSINMNSEYAKEFSTVDSTTKTPSTASDLPKQTTYVPQAYTKKASDSATLKTGFKGTPPRKSVSAYDIKYQRNINPFPMLGAYPDIDSSYQEIKYDVPFRGLHSEQDYCERVDLYNIQNPDNMFKQKNFYTDFPKRYLPRARVMDRIGTVLMTNSTVADAKDMRKYHLDHRITAFHMDGAKLHQHYKVGTNFLCATQMYNHIPGIEVLTEKAKVVNQINKYIKKYEDRPQCFNESSLFPHTYRLYIKEECNSFFDLINSQKYKKSLKTNAIQYVIKVTTGMHKSMGVFLLDAEKTVEINQEYNNGARCGLENKSLIAQTYVNNPLLLNLNNKFDFRVYMLIASTNPFIAYYHDGFLRVSLYPYEKSSTNRATHLTNTYLANIKIAEAKKENKTMNGMTAKEMSEYILWDFERFQNYLLESGRIVDPNWLDNYLRPAFHKAMIHLIRMTSDSLWKQSNVYTMHGVDFMLDDQMKLWFIESNPSPLLTGTTKSYIYYDVLTSMFEIQFKYYRSRMKRVMKVISQIQKEASEKQDVDYAKWRKVYQEAVKNRLEPEYQVSKSNTYTLIMDDNLKGADAYFGQLDKQCI